jgi:hypothetical protein
MTSMVPRVALPADEELAAALLPVLLHRINNTTQLLLGVRSMVESGGGPVPARCSGDLGVAAREAHELGWLLGLLSGGLGADLLLARHESAGLAPLMRLVREGLRRAGRTVEFRSDPLPLLGASGHGALVCWTIALSVWNAAQRAAPARTLGVEFERHASRWSVRGDSGADDGWLALASQACARLAGAECSRDGQAWNLVLPGSWLEPAAR